jgi:hypothetical protein
LDSLIANVCDQDKIKHQRKILNGYLMPFVLANLITLASTRVEGFISSGSKLFLEYRMIIMSFINSYTTCIIISQNNYHTGKMLNFH